MLQIAVTVKRDVNDSQGREEEGGACLLQDGMLGERQARSRVCHAPAEVCDWQTLKRIRYACWPLVRQVGSLCRQDCGRHDGLSLVVKRV